MSERKLLLTTAIAATFVTALVVGVLRGGLGRPPTTVTMPASRPAVSATGPADTPPIAGSASCRQCHERFYQLWATSHHGLAMQPYTPAFARDNFSSQENEIAIGPHRYRAEIDSETGWIVENGPAGERKIPIVHVLGGKNVYYFLTPTERGRLQTLPLAYDVRRQEWFDTAGSGMRHVPGGTADAPLHWTDREYTFNTSCYSCHVSQLSTNYDLTTDTYRTAWAEPGINCETCHGPGAEHVRVCREAPEGQVPEDLKIIITKRFDVEQTNALCAPCHAQMVPLTSSFKPGDRYFDHYDLVTLEDPDFYPDGRDLGENYTYTLWRMNPCAKAGKLDCLHCHASSGRFRFKDEPNRSCLPCHAERVANASAHTHHPADSESSLCIKCHMPMTEFARMRRSDHSMLPPTPATTVAFESPNACNLCHTDEDAAWADKQVREWHAHDYQQPVLFRARLIAAAREGDWSQLPEVLSYLQSPERDEVSVTGLIRMLRGCDHPEKWPVIIRTLNDPSPLVRAAAAEALDGWFSHESVRALLVATRDEFRLVRVRAAAALAGIPPEALEEQDRDALAKATAEFTVAMHARPDDAASHYNLGNFYLERRQLKQALACFERSQKLDPRLIQPLVNASIAYSLAGDNDMAEASLRRALAIEPTSVAANINLGMLLGEMGRTPEAEDAFRAALKADPKSAVAAYNLGVILAEGDTDQAIDLCRKAAELRPDEPKYAYTLAFYLRQSGRTADAITTLQQMLVRHPDHLDGHLLLGEALEQQGRTEEAIGVYRRAIGIDQVPAQVRARLAARIQMLSLP